MAYQSHPPLAFIQAKSWGDLAAASLAPNWLGRVREASESSLLVLSQDGEVVRFVTEQIGDGPFHVVVEEGAAKAWQGVPRDLYAWRVRDRLWLGDDLTIQLPDSAPWSSTLSWEREPDANVEDLARHLAQLADWVMARAPEGSIAELLPEMLVADQPLGKAADRPDLPPKPRLFRWRAARILGELLPALTTGNIATAETAVNSLAGLGPGAPPAGDWFMLGFMAGSRLWPEFITEGSGLRTQALLQRLARSVAERTSLLGCVTLHAALDGRWSVRWHALYAALHATGPYPDLLREEVENVAAEWLMHDDVTGSAALAGLVVPFLWYQRFLAT